MKSIMFFIESLDGGGAEQILETLITNIPQSRFCCTLYSAEECPQSIARHLFFFKKNPQNIFEEIIKKVKVKLSLTIPETFVKELFIRGKYDIEIAFCEGYATKLVGNARKRKGTKRIAWVHTDVINNPWSERIFNSAEKERMCYEKFDAIICVSETMKESFIKKYGMAQKVHVLYNAIDIEKIRYNALENSEIKLSDKHLNFIMVGRLVKIKGYERIIKIADKLKKERYDFSISILGRGTMFEKLENMISDMNLCDNIKLLGYKQNPHCIMSKADAVLCSSYAEGYSTTGIESIVLGKPFITTECSGMREIFGDKQCGIICENSEEGLYNALKKVLDNPECLKEFAQNAAERAKDFDVNKRIAELEDFLDSL